MSRFITGSRPAPKLALIHSPAEHRRNLASTMPDIAKSDISPNLDRDKMFNELWWLNYCFCEGVGIGAVGNPFFGGEAVNICLHSRCEMTDIGDPFCSNIRVCLCITDQCSLPPAPGSPICVCFNKKLAGADGWSGQQLFDWSTSFGDTFWLYYIFCFGIGFSAPSANGRPLFAVQVKELCIKGGTKLATPMEGGKLCSAVSTRLCCSQFLVFENRCHFYGSFEFAMS